MEAAQNAYLIAPEKPTVDIIDNVKAGIASIIATIYAGRRENELALPYYEEALLFYQQKDEKYDVYIHIITLSNVASTYSDLGQYQKATGYLEEALILSKEANSQESIAYISYNLSKAAIDQRDFDRAKPLLEQAIAIFNELDIKRRLFIAHKTMVQLAIETNDMELANKSLTLAGQNLAVEKNPYSAVDSFELLEVDAAVNFQKGNYKEAYELMKLTGQRKEQYLNDLNSEQLYAIQARYEIDASERENELLERQNQLQQSQLQSAQLRETQLKLLFATLAIISLLLAYMAYRAKRNRATLLYHANTDGLTGLSNRRHSLEMMNEALKASKQTEARMSIAIVDIDHFKKINDNYGHAAGDDALKAFGNLCISTFKTSDILGRIGGEEFVIALPNMNIDESEERLKKLLNDTKVVRQNLNIGSLGLTVSIGLTEASPDLTTEEVLINCDEALYQAKERGRNQIVRHQTQRPND